MTRTKLRTVIPIIVMLILAAASVAVFTDSVHADVAYGNTYANVAAVQTRLNTLGYYKMSIDGR